MQRLLSYYHYRMRDTQATKGMYAVKLRANAATLLTSLRLYLTDLTVLGEVRARKTQRINLMG